MQVRYTGMFDEVMVPEVSRTRTVKRGEPIEVDDALAARLLAQPDWEALPVVSPAKGRGER